MKVLLTGASGFVGTAVLAALRARRVWVRGLKHRRDADVAEQVDGDLGEPTSLRGCCNGISTLVHVAAHVHDDADTCERVNGAGTRALIGEARRAGVNRFVYVSSTAVYGMAEHSDAAEESCHPAPVTPISRSRWSAEQAVLEVGGATVRPLFVYGKGDQRFLPAVTQALRRLPFLVEGGRAKISVIDVRDLGNAVAGLALLPAVPQGIWHATDDRPVVFAELVGALHALCGTPIPRFSLPWPLARLAVRVMAPRVTGRDRWTPSAEHRLFLIGRNHSYNSGRLWSALGWRPNAGLLERLSALDLRGCGP